MSIDTHDDLDILDLLFELERPGDIPFPQHVVDVFSMYFPTSVLVFFPGPTHELMAVDNYEGQLIKQQQYYIASISNRTEESKKRLSEYTAYLTQSDLKQPVNIPQHLRGRTALRFSDILPDEEFEKTKMYAYLKKVGYLNNVTIYLYEEDVYLAGIAFVRPTNEEPYSEAEVRMLEIASKFITPLYSTYLRGVYNKAIIEIYRSHYDNEKTGFAILSSNLDVIECNMIIQEYSRKILEECKKKEGKSQATYVETNPIKRVLNRAIERADSFTQGFEQTFQGEKSNYHCEFRPSVMVPVFSELQTFYIFMIHEKELVNAELESTVEHTAKQYSLTNQEKAILRLVAEGHNTKSISESLCISPHTVKKHLSNIYRKTNVTSRIALFKKLTAS